MVANSALGNFWRFGGCSLGRVGFGEGREEKRPQHGTKPKSPPFEAAFSAGESMPRPEGSLVVSNPLKSPSLEMSHNSEESPCPTWKSAILCTSLMPLARDGLLQC